MYGIHVSTISLRLLLTVLTLLWMVLIFHMSSAVKDESNAQSGVICEFLCEVFVEGYEDMPPEQQLQMQERFSFPVRKGAHLTEYMILGILLTLTAVSYRTNDMESLGRFNMISHKMLDVGESHNWSRSESEQEEGRGSVGTSYRGQAEMPFVSPFLIGFFYAISDEIHQYFVPGRAMQARDVLIDTVGVLLGIWITRRITRRWGRL